MYTPESWQTPIGAQNLGAGTTWAVMGDDAALNVKFCKFPIVNEFETEKQGLKVWKDVLFVHIPIDRKSTYFGEASASHIRRFPRQYEAFLSGKTEALGIPLDKWDYELGTDEIMRLKYVSHIEYVHQLAALPDTQYHVLGLDASRIVNRARLTITEHLKKEEKADLQDQLDATKKALEAQQAQTAQIMKLLEARQYEEEKESEEEGRRLLGAAPVKRQRRTKKDH